ncbi:Hsp33 family molecular chaperone HslO [Thiotrichales bacterium 19S3-7]|nr:Hsp33 family molecular chaperone HslO [Thiotrichales bacterium 19S3-7]MCF6800669.1 Hsp33 family molecular chaperone HslO [Thiotrichales bacterium 19S3-11]
MMINRDIYQRFILEKLSIRGAYIEISNVYEKLLSIKNYNKSQQDILTQAFINSIFLCQNKLIHGRALLQYKNTHTDDLIIAQATSTGYVRAMLKSNNEVINLSSGQLSVFYQPDDVAQHQQSLIELRDNDLFKSIQDYFSLSEQTDTSLWYFKNSSKIIGIYLQKIPFFEEDYQVARALLNGLNREDVLVENCHTTLIDCFDKYHLSFHDTVELNYGCENSTNRFKNALATLDKEDLSHFVKNHETVDITCDFCEKTCSFSQEEVLEILK